MAPQKNSFANYSSSTCIILYLKVTFTFFTQFLNSKSCTICYHMLYVLCCSILLRGQKGWPLSTVSLSFLSLQLVSANGKQQQERKWQEKNEVRTVIPLELFPGRPWVGRSQVPLLKPLHCSRQSAFSSSYSPFSGFQCWLPLLPFYQLTLSASVLPGRWTKNFESIQLSKGRIGMQIGLKLFKIV